MKKNKFIPLAVIAGLCFVSVAMNKKNCTNEQNKPVGTDKKQCKDYKDNNKSVNRTSCDTKCDKKSTTTKRNKYTK